MDPAPEHLRPLLGDLLPPHQELQRPSTEDLLQRLLVEVRRQRVKAPPVLEIEDSQGKHSMEVRMEVQEDRYGFHGIEHASLAEEAAALEKVPSEKLNAVTLQLGQGCSACAVLEGQSYETSMGFTPLEGLVMGARSGNVDPALVLHLLRRGRSVDEVETILTRRSGLLGLAGTADKGHHPGRARVNYT